MDAYDPETAPKPADWLAMDEQERILLVEDYHRVALIDLPDVSAHALFHVIIENQIAGKLQSVLQAMNRLSAEGLDRHDALHAIGSVLSEHMFRTLKYGDRGPSGTIQSGYESDLARLTAKRWRKRYGGT